MLLYRDKHSGVPVKVVFEFTGGKLDSLSYVADPLPGDPETVFLQWCLELTKQDRRGEAYLDKTPVGDPALALDESLARFWKTKDGEILVIIPVQGILTSASESRWLRVCPLWRLILPQIPGGKDSSMEKANEDELRRKAKEQSHDEIADPEMTVDGLTEEEKKLDIHDEELAAVEGSSLAKRPE